ncbi:LysR family transcriptional regulator [Paraburkholderia caballeronis]|uniref:DNA-binding transcriptional regulator, LysR family n=1 Tax=Paraburkholderia caballeronis TaxID=416943 RepID=A0A1H7PPH3_9BURK|nr:LysR family transcriptional regulator [Paraburkholderia caballeronis]PXW24276.1 LysR family transcriptional regulator [Paraburkholderia caballeronis]PXX00058.1 LysR family transcriptional regulator [Paraburkholderia caballeronis]RAJ97187.1 LysR family transcriptional regulator [Paraburkholderia caballeronis]TDV08326.1 LysR family transcriptional regulator [Paraburkholderia caballeronis]TDV12018.1 LysR family transcriptional regulator [Paraburkholderia caballeronis]
MDRSPSLEQLRALIAVAETGSFSAAARQLDRAQSVVSYTIANLETMLGVALFERGRRKPELTPAGRAILADARRLDLLMGQLSAKALGLQRGLEGEVSVAVDVMFPSQRLVEALQAFALAFPTVALNLTMEALGGVLKLVLDGDCAFGISGPNHNWPHVIEAESIATVELMLVAAPGHPLARPGPPIPISEAREHTQLVLADRSRLTEGQTFGVYSNRTWKLGDLGAKHRLLLAGLGWGSMPRHLVEADLQAGRLVSIALSDRRSVNYNVSLIHRTDAAIGPASRWLSRYLSNGKPPGEPLPDAR